MIWQHHAKLHWKCDDIKPYVCEVKVVMGKGFTVWRIQKDGLTIQKGRDTAPLDAMDKMSNIVFALREQDIHAAHPPKAVSAEQNLAFMERNKDKFVQGMGEEEYNLKKEQLEQWILIRNAVMKEFPGLTLQQRIAIIKSRFQIANSTSQTLIQADLGPNASLNAKKNLFES